MGMSHLDSELEYLYRRRHDAFQVMLASATGSVESARDVVQETAPDHSHARVRR